MANKEKPQEEPKKGEPKKNVGKIVETPHAPKSRDLD
jgi:hypothetical protein